MAVNVDFANHPLSRAALTYPLEKIVQNTLRSTVVMAKNCKPVNPGCLRKPFGQTKSITVAIMV